MNEETRGSSILTCDTTPRDRRNLYLYLGTCVLWAIVLTAATRAIKGGLVVAGPAGWLVAALPTVAALVVIRTYLRYLRDTDELQRLIHLRATGVGFASAWVALCGYPLFERLGAKALDASDYVVILAVVYSIAVIVGSLRYR